MDDEALMRRAAEGDMRAFEQLVRTHQQTLVRFGTRLLGDAEAGRDAAQEAFVRLWRARTRYRPQGRLRSLLLRIVRNVCLDYARTFRATEPLAEALCEAADTRQSPEQDVQARTLAEAVRQAVSELPEAQRVVFVLSQYEGLSYPEIAETLGCPVGTVASRKRLATETLRRRLAPWRDEE